MRERKGLADIHEPLAHYLGFNNSSPSGVNGNAVDISFVNLFYKPLLLEFLDDEGAGFGNMHACKLFSNGQKFSLLVYDLLFV